MPSGRVRLKKFALLLGFVSTIPVALLISEPIANYLYFRFSFEGDIKDFAPGDAFGVFFYACIIALGIITASIPIWLAAYRRRQDQTNQP